MVLSLSEPSSIPNAYPTLASCLIKYLAWYSRTSPPSTARPPKSCSKSTRRARARTTSHTCVPSHSRTHPTCPLLTPRRHSRRSLHMRLERTRTGRWRARPRGVTGLQAHGIRCELLRGARCTWTSGARDETGCICSTGVGPDFLYSSTRSTAHAPAVFSSSSPRPVLACLLLSQGLFPSRLLPGLGGADGRSAVGFAGAPGNDMLSAIVLFICRETSPRCNPAGFKVYSKFGQVPHWSYTIPVIHCSQSRFT